MELSERLVWSISRIKNQILTIGNLVIKFSCSVRKRMMVWQRKPMKVKTGGYLGHNY